jgi:DNA helicase-2/ATP-dependent DNA helicase PcrA
MNLLADIPQKTNSGKHIAKSVLDHLNPSQRQAVKHGTENGIDEPLLVIAGAGSGKTNTLAHRVAHLIAKGNPPDVIMLLTFSRRAAIEMSRRAERIVQELAVDMPALAGMKLNWTGTFHSVGARLLREYAGRIGLDSGFTIHDRSDSADLMNLVRHELGASSRETRFPLKNTCLSIYSAVINTRSSLDDILQQQFPWCSDWQDELKKLFREYVEAKHKQNVLDYDDLLLCWAQMVYEPKLADEIGSRFAHILVDEYQDTNALQASILLALKPDGCGLTIVGDDAQAIYAFRGATVCNILDFPQRFNPPAKVVTLEQNYRSTQPILAAANAVIGLAAEQYRKNLWSNKTSGGLPQLLIVRDETSQAACVVEQVLALRETGIKLKSQAVLFRASHHSATLEIELLRSNIPFVKFGGLKFLEAAHIKDVLSVLRWVENPRDRVAGFRVMQLIPGVGPKTSAQVLENLAKSQDIVMGLQESRIPSTSTDDWGNFVDMVAHLVNRSVAWPLELETISNWYQNHMERLYEDARVRQIDIEQLTRIAATYPSRQRFLTELTLDPPDATSDESGAPLRDEDYLILSTIHSAKGQEWTSVTLLNAVDGCLPSDLATGSVEEIEEERRLLYVAMTRAKEHLQIMVPQRFFVTQQSQFGDRHVYAGRTRFIPASITNLFEMKTWPVVEASSVQQPTRSREEVLDLLGKMKAMWE